MFALEGTWLSIYPRDKLAEDAMIADDGRGFSGFALAQPSDADRVFVTEASAAAAAGMEMGRIALKRGNHSSVRDFARKTVEGDARSHACVRPCAR